MQNDEYLEIYFYDEKKGGRGFTTGYKMPKQIAENALRVVSTRYTTEAQEMQMMEQLVHDNGSLSDISSYNQQVITIILKLHLLYLLYYELNSLFLPRQIIIPKNYDEMFF